MLVSMVAFWDVVQELLNITQPAHLVEIGGDKGLFTQKLCTWASPTQAWVYVIETQPEDTLKHIVEQYQFSKLYIGRSLEILPTIENTSCFIIDGDHNYYTVYNELKLIVQHNQPTLILLHDIGWPWGHRDLYYDVNAIPDEYRHDYVTDPNLGIIPGFADVLPHRGLSGKGRFSFAKLEGGVRNGVLTAVEDFLSENLDYQLFTIDCVFGLGILVPKSTPHHGQIKTLLNRYVGNPLITLLEDDRLRSFVNSLNTPQPTPSSVVVSANLQTGKSAYIDLIKRTLLDLIYSEPDDMVTTNRHETVTVAEARQSGRDWPEYALTMIGLERLNNIQFCVEDVLQRGIPGDFTETGVWRGGSCIFMRAILKAHEVTDRTVWVADSFQGLPKPDSEHYPLDKDLDLSEFSQLAVSRPEVAHNFERFGLLDDQVQFLEGWFKDTLPNAPIEQLAVLRLDGDLYQSTMEALVALYPKLVPGGYIIIDDYGAVGQCRQAVNDYRTQHGIAEEIHAIDWTGVYWQRTLPQPSQPESPVANAVTKLRESYHRCYDSSLREWLFYHQRQLVLSQCRWQGIPTLKNPLDMWIYQQLLYDTKPDILIEIGSKFGGSTLYFAHILDTIGNGQVISIDISRTAYQVHHARIIEITGNSNSPHVVEQTRKLCKGKRVMLIHDGSHTYPDVLRDLELYSEFISVDCYMIVEDGIVDLYPMSTNPGESSQALEPSFKGPGPLWAIADFLIRNNDFQVDSTQERYWLTQSPHGFLKRVQRTQPLTRYGSGHKKTLRKLNLKMRNLARRFRLLMPS